MSPTSKKRVAAAISAIHTERDLPPLERHHGWKEIFSADARAELTGRRHDWDPVDVLQARFAETEGSDLLARLQDVDLGVYLVVSGAFSSILLALQEKEDE